MFATMAHFDPRGRVAPHVRRQVEALRSAADRVIVVSTADLLAEDEDWLRDRVELVRRENFGYDFFSYRTGLLAAPEITDYDHVILCNDTYVGPLTDYPAAVSLMDQRPVDFWGMTYSQRIAPHVQSFFVCFNSWVVRSEAFTRFWHRMTPLSDRLEVIRRYEVGMSEGLQNAGFRGGGFLEEQAADRRLARARMWWWAARRAQQTPLRSRRQHFSKVSIQHWNPAVALADRALTQARLPLVKIDTLRYDPYGLDAGHLLDLCEAAYPQHFADVRAYLQDTSSFYQVRPAEKLAATSPLLKPLAPAVRYRS